LPRCAGGSRPKAPAAATAVTTLRRVGGCENITILLGAFQRGSIRVAQRGHDILLQANVVLRWVFVRSVLMVTRPASVRHRAKPRDHSLANPDLLLLLRNECPLWRSFTVPARPQECPLMRADRLWQHCQVITKRHCTGMGGVRAKPKRMVVRGGNSRWQSGIRYESWACLDTPPWLRDRGAKRADLPGRSTNEIPTRDQSQKQRRRWASPCRHHCSIEPPK
jgi:hypothetical protein